MRVLPSKVTIIAGREVDDKNVDSQCGCNAKSMSTRSDRAAARLGSDRSWKTSRLIVRKWSVRVKQMSCILLIKMTRCRRSNKENLPTNSYLPGPCREVGLALSKVKPVGTRGSASAGKILRMERPGRSNNITVVRVPSTDESDSSGRRTCR